MLWQMHLMKNAIGTVWNAWETTWSGIVSVDAFHDRIHPSESKKNN